MRRRNFGTKAGGDRFAAIPVPVDSYGFFVDGGQTPRMTDAGPGEVSAREQALRERVAVGRAAKWAKMLDDFDRYATSKPAKLKRRVRKGIPDGLRDAAWTRLSGAARSREAHHGVTYEKLCARAAAGPAHADFPQIEEARARSARARGGARFSDALPAARRPSLVPAQDLRRTYPTHCLFEVPSVPTPPPADPDRVVAGGAPPPPGDDGADGGDAKDSKADDVADGAPDGAGAGAAAGDGLWGHAQNLFAPRRPSAAGVTTAIIDLDAHRDPHDSAGALKRHSVDDAAPRDEVAIYEWSGLGSLRRVLRAYALLDPEVRRARCERARAPSPALLATRAPAPLFSHSSATANPCRSSRPCSSCITCRTRRPKPRPPRPRANARTARRARSGCSSP